MLSPFTPVEKREQYTEFDPTSYLLAHFSYTLVRHVYVMVRLVYCS